MAKTKAELQDELIGLRNENKRAKVRLEELESDLNYVNARNTELEISNNTLILESRKSKSANASLINKIDEETKGYERLYNAHVKLGEALREAKEQLQVQEEVTVEMVKQFDNVLMERHEKIKSLKSQNNNLRQTLKDTL